MTHPAARAQPSFEVTLFSRFAPPILSARSRRAYFPELPAVHVAARRAVANNAEFIAALLSTYEVGFCALKPCIEFLPAALTWRFLWILPTKLLHRTTTCPTTCESSHWTASFRRQPPETLRRFASSSFQQLLRPLPPGSPLKPTRLCVMEDTGLR